MSYSSRRIHKELDELKHSTKTDISKNISAGPQDENNIYDWDGALIGETGTLYEGGLFKLKITFPTNYPFSSPKIKFITNIYHPNIHENGEICLDILKYHWSPSYSITQVLSSVLTLLSEPNPDDPLNPDAAKLYKNNYEMYSIMVKDYVITYAQ